MNITITAISNNNWFDFTQSVNRFSYIYIIGTMQVSLIGVVANACNWICPIVFILMVHQHQYPVLCFPLLLYYQKMKGHINKHIQKQTTKYSNQHCCCYMLTIIIYCLVAGFQYLYSKSPDNLCSFKYHNISFVVM